MPNRLESIIQKSVSSKVEKTINQPNGTNIFNAETIRKCEKYVRSIQRKLDKAVASNNIEKIRWYTHILSKKSKAAKILAVHHVTTNVGSKTAGIDGVRILQKKGIIVPKARREIDELNLKLKLELLNGINIKKKPSPIRRVLIPKPNGKMRPLGIPTIMDRIIQDILRMALEPITEYHANPNSYGFRPRRSCHDAIEHIFDKLSQKGSPRWILEGDIKGCFDNISHEHICNTLLKWKTQKSIVKIIERMLKSKIFYNNEYETSEKGTPQGGILSPMLANVALTELDDYCEKQFGRKYYNKTGKNTNNPIIRYADDFVITAKSEVEAEYIRDRIKKFLKEKIDLDLSDEKTHITNIHDGFNFLGFSIRKYRNKSKYSKYNHVGILLIKPQKQKVDKLLRKIQDILNNNKQATVDWIIRKLNPILQGFAMYYRFMVSKKTFSFIQHKVWWKIRRWSKRRHPKKSIRWIHKRYYAIKEKVKGIFWSKETRKRLIQIPQIPIVRFVKIKSNMRIHDEDKKTIEYWIKRAYVNALSQIYSVKVEKLYKRQEGICPCCEKIITKEQIAEQEIHIHHMLPRSEGGTDYKLNDLRLSHNKCHRQIHSLLTRKQMAFHWLKKPKLNYFSKKCIAEIIRNPKALAIPVVA